MANTIEVLLRFTGDSRQLQQVVSSVRGDLSRLAQTQTANAARTSQQTLNEAIKGEQRRVTETIKAANQRLREEQRAAREVVRIMAETARQAEAQEKLRERAAKNLANVQIKEAKRAAKELEQSLGASVGGGDALANIANQIPAVRNLTSQFSGLTAGATAATSAVAAVAAGVALMVAGAVVAIGVIGKLTVEFFQLTKQTADFQGKFFDLSQQVGVSVETLSTLDVMAQRTGGNIDTVTASLALFQRNLEDAHDPTSEEAKLLTRLGVTSLDTETALRQAAKGLFALGEGAEQTDAVLQLFGRSGRFMNAILKESKGDLDEAAKGMKGMLITQEAAIAADAFNDSLGDLQRVLAGLTRSLVTDSIPVFTLFFQEISIALVGSASGWQTWGREIADVITFVIANVKALAQFVASQGTIEFDTLLRANFEALLREAEKLRVKYQIDASIDFARRLATAVNAGRPGDRPDTDKARSEAAARANKALQLQQQALEESTRVHREELERQRRLDLVSIDEWETQSKQAAFDHRQAQNEIFDRELVDARRYVQGREDLLLIEIEIMQKRTKAVNQEIEALQKIREEAQKKRDQLELKLNAQLLQITEAARQEELAIIQRALERQQITEEGAALRQLDILKESHNQRLVLIDLELKQLTTSAERKVELDNEKIKSEQEYTRQVEALTQKRIEALLKEGAAGVPSPGGKGVPTGTTVPINVGLPPPETLTAQIDGAIQAQGAFAGLGVAISDALGQGRETAVAFAETITESFGLMAQAVGDSVKAFLLFGTAQGSFRKFAAEVIASIAQMAIVQALWETAQALAMIALSWFTGNPKYAQSAGAHWAAAAAYGIIAGVTAPLARLTAGNEFSQGSGGGGGGGGGSSTSGGGTATTSTQPQPVNIDRATSNQNAVKQVLEVRFTGKLGDVIEANWIDRYNGGGRLRNVVMTDRDN